MKPKQPANQPSMMIMMFLFRKMKMIINIISYLIVIHDDIDASTLEGVKDSKLHFIVNNCWWS